MATLFRGGEECGRMCDAVSLFATGSNVDAPEIDTSLFPFSRSAPCVSHARQRPPGLCEDMKPWAGYRRLPPNANFFPSETFTSDPSWCCHEFRLFAVYDPLPEQRRFSRAPWTKALAAPAISRAPTRHRFVASSQIRPEWRELDSWRAQSDTTIRASV